MRSSSVITLWLVSGSVSIVNSNRYFSLFSLLFLIISLIKFTPTLISYVLTAKWFSELVFFFNWFIILFRQQWIYIKHIPKTHIIFGQLWVHTCRLVVICNGNCKKIFAAIYYICCGQVRFELLLKLNWNWMFCLSLRKYWQMCSYFSYFFIP